MIDDDWDSVTSRITLDPGQVDATAVTGLDQFSHVEVVYVFDQVDPAVVERGARHPRSNPDWPSVGILAQRARMRPNRLGVTVCRLVGVDGLTVEVADLDAVDGTPVVDIKPYMAEFGPRGPVRQPVWSHQLMSGYWDRAHGDGSPPSSTRASYDRVADHYHAELADELGHKPLDRALLTAFAESAGDGLIADIGAGPGQAGRFIRDLGRQVVTSDLSPGMCRRAAVGGPPTVAADMVDLPFRDGSLAGVVSLYAVIHLDRERRVGAYRQFERVLRPGGLALIAFHIEDAEHAAGAAIHRRSWFDTDVDLTFRFLDPALETGALTDAGFEPLAQLVRRGGDGGEYPSRRAYLLMRVPG
ncbi:MAG TPA: TrmO family methyltransferase [Acidimicrobiales bacterium]|nr:TrmO family methyltransferase [Acidimicrobiales bacterium]